MFKNKKHRDIFLAIVVAALIIIGCGKVTKDESSSGSGGGGDSGFTPAYIGGTSNGFDGGVSIYSQSLDYIDHAASDNRGTAYFSPTTDAHIPGVTYNGTYKVVDSDGTHFIDPWLPVLEKQNLAAFSYEYDDAGDTFLLSYIQNISHADRTEVEGDYYFIDVVTANTGIAPPYWGTVHVATMGPWSLTRKTFPGDVEVFSGSTTANQITTSNYWQLSFSGGPSLKMAIANGLMVILYDNGTMAVGTKKPASSYTGADVSADYLSLPANLGVAKISLDSVGNLTYIVDKGTVSTGNFSVSAVGGSNNSVFTRSASGGNPDFRGLVLSNSSSKKILFGLIRHSGGSYDSYAGMSYP